MSAFRVCFAKIPKNWLDYWQGSHQLVFLVRIHNNELATDNFGKSKKKCNSCTISYLAKEWGVSRNFPLNNMNKANDHVVTAQGERTQNPTQQRVIDSFKAAQIHYSAKHLFIAHRVEERTN
jgi:hypothetical protein